MSRVDEIRAELAELTLQIKVLSASSMGAPRYFSLRAACEYKGVQYNSIRPHKEKQPRFGVPDKMDGSKKYWSLESVIEWAEVMDSSDWMEYRGKYPHLAAAV